MTLFQASGFILICLMIRIVYLATRYVSEVEYDGRGIYYITVNAWFRNNYQYKEWLKNNKVYHWCILFILSLCFIILLLVDSYRRNDLFMVAETSILFNIFLCISILKAQLWFVKRLSK